MSSYLRPRRGTSTNASGQNIKLQKGEIFMEFPNGSTIGKSPGRIIIGDGSSSYSALKSVSLQIKKLVFPFIFLN